MARPRPYRAGLNNSPVRVRTESKLGGNLAEHFEANHAQITLIIERNKDSHELGPEVKLRVGKQFVNLSDMTEEELSVMRELIQRAFSLASPVARHRDKKAREAFDEGRDDFNRLYRRAPYHFVRPWASTLNGKSILRRFTDLPPMDESDQRPSNIAITESEPEVSQRNEEPKISNDSESVSDEFQDFQ
jgi:hypothetical protein